MKKSASIFLGLDSSTQGLKAVAIDARLAVHAEFAVNYDADLPDYTTRGGVHHHPDGLTVTAPPRMWAEALDLLLGRMRAAQFPFARVVAISGSGQQHGSVYFRRGARGLLNKLDAMFPVSEQLRDAFSVEDSPIWMDSSTTDECRRLERALGGAQATAAITGSRAYERFTGNQIAKIARKQKAAYAATEHISLVSSFMASLLIGDYAPIDVSDGSGMNVMDIGRRRWCDAALDACAPGLAPLLGTLALSHTTAGRIHSRYVERYGFSPDCKVIVFSGDNPNSLAGLRLQEAGDIAISLGTSDTVFAALATPRPSASEGHIFASPIDPRGYMALICYKNGSLTREYIRDRAAGRSWAKFNALLLTTAPGNDGRIGFYYKDPEITPPVMKAGMFRFGADDKPVKSFIAAQEVRAVVEGQFLSMRLHGCNIGIKPTRILATGGASANPAIIKIMSDVFGVPVYTGAIPNSAALGAAYRALHGWQCDASGKFQPFGDVIKGPSGFKRAASPDRAAHITYTALLKRYATLEAKIATY